MPPPSPEVLVENLRRTLRGGIAHYAALRREALAGEIEEEVAELGLLLGQEWPHDPDAAETARLRARLAGLLDSLCDAAREDLQATQERRAATEADAPPPVTEAVDRWLERWLSGSEAGRLP